MLCDGYDSNVWPRMESIGLHCRTSEPTRRSALKPIGVWWAGGGQAIGNVIQSLCARILLHVVYTKKKETSTRQHLLMYLYATTAQNHLVGGIKKDMPKRHVLIG